MKVIGYLVALVGLIGIFSTIEIGAKLLPFLSGFPRVNVLIASIVLIVIGIFLIMSGGGRRKSRRDEGEVPIYEGGRVVGYRRG